MNFNCLMAGVGGQGTVLASKLLAGSAVNDHHFARTCETIGMAQRGGCVVSHVRIGEQNTSPLIPQGGADLIIGFEPSEAVRVLPYLKQGGTVVAAINSIAPVTASLGMGSYQPEETLEFLRSAVDSLILVDANPLCEEIGSYKTLNVILLGAALASGVLPVSREILEQTLKDYLPQKLWQMNLLALEKGFESVKNQEVVCK